MLEENIQQLLNNNKGFLFVILFSDNMTKIKINILTVSMDVQPTK